MWKISFWIVDKYRAFQIKRGKSQVSPERIRICRCLYPTKDPVEYTRKQDAGLVRKSLAVALAGWILWILVTVTSSGPMPLLFLERPGYGALEEYGLEVQTEGGHKIPVEIKVKGKTYTPEEAEAAILRAYEEILGAMLGDNISPDHIDSNLTLPEKAQAGLVTVDWTSMNRELLDDWGQILKSPEEISEEGETGGYAVTLTCGEYVREYEIFLRIYPYVRTKEERLAEELKQLIEVSSSSEGEAVILPDHYKGEQLVWYEAEENLTKSWVLFLPVAMICLLIAKSVQNRKEKLKIREKEMRMDYPELVSKFTVLLQAGMTARNVWERLVSEYEEERKKGAKPRYVYEEMRITRNQLKNGVYEARAYGEFGRRCGLHGYMKFGALLEQNLRQGTTGLAARLREEAEGAFEERKALAKRLGEEAETKLMLPMFLLLGITLAVIISPTLWSF